MRTGVERQERGHDVRRVHRIAGPAAEDGVVAVLALARRAVLAAFEPAVDAGIAEVPAARPLQEIAAERREIADLQRGGERGGLGERGVPFAHQRMLLDFGECRERADLEPLRLRFDAARQQRLHVDEPLGRRQVGLEERQ